MSMYALIGAAIGSILAAWSLGVFRIEKIIGPERLGPNESPRVFPAALGFGLAAWAFCPLLFQIIHASLQQNHHQPPTTQLSEPETVVFSGIMEIIVLAGMLAGTAITRFGGIRRMGFSPDRIPTGLLAGIGAISIALPLILVVNQVTESTLDHFGKSHPAHQLLEVLKENPPPWLQIADVICAGVLAPITEEMFFRGLLQTAFRYLFKRSWPAIFLSAALFALVHPWWTWPQIFFLGICLGYAYERTANLWMSITMHASFNLLSIYLFTHFT
jgi:membrane protease YdiL (CAAX protease family)